MNDAITGIYGNCLFEALSLPDSAGEIHIEVFVFWCYYSYPISLLVTGKYRLPMALFVAYRLQAPGS
jgi:hypothetical protein